MIAEGQNVEFTESVYVPGLGTIPQGNRGHVVTLYGGGSEASVQINSYGTTALVPTSKLTAVTVERYGLASAGQVVEP